MPRFTAKGYCGEEHNIDELHACPKCRFYMKGWDEAIEAVVKEFGSDERRIKIIRRLKK